MTECRTDQLCSVWTILAGVFSVREKLQDDTSTDIFVTQCTSLMVYNSGEFWL